MNPVYATFKKWFALSIFGCSLIALSVGFTNVYITHVRVPSPEAVLGVDRYLAYVTVQSVDATQKTMHLVIKSNIIAEDIVTRVWLASDFFAERRDAILDKDGTVIGTTERTPISTSSVQPGMRGLAVLRLLDNGTLQLYYLQLGTPFPRP